MEIRERNGVTIRVYTEWKYKFPLFHCVKCSEESYYAGYDTCRDCLRVCRCCGVNVAPDEKWYCVVPETKKILVKPLYRHICFLCYKGWMNNRKFQLQQAIKDGWQRFGFRK